jgi:hypothetical protein
MKWLVPPYGLEVFTRYEHWAKVHASLEHTYVKDTLPMVFPEGGMFDWAFSELKHYRQAMGGAWYLVKSPPILNTQALWVREALDVEELLAFELYYSDKHHVV